jgi:hypothetical protein
MNADAEGFDLDRDVPTTPEDVAVLLRLRADTPGWFSLTPADLLTLLPPDALDRRPPTPPTARPFVLVPEDDTA